MVWYREKSDPPNEHLADWQGFMEGAIETGEAAAESLIK